MLEISDVDHKRFSVWQVQTSGWLLQEVPLDTHVENIEIHAPDLSVQNETILLPLKRPPPLETQPATHSGSEGRSTGYNEAELGGTGCSSIKCSPIVEVVAGVILLSVKSD